jgi:hypothetical protein
MNPLRQKLQRKTKIEGCCDDFTTHINRFCDQHGFDCRDNIIRFYTNSDGNPTFGLAHPDEFSFIVIRNCPWCGKSLQPIVYDSVDGFVKYTVVFINDESRFIGIINNRDIRYGTYGSPYFPKFVNEKEYGKLFGITYKKLCKVGDGKEIVEFLRKNTKFKFDSYTILT